jgi:hypothetical protein
MVELATDATDRIFVARVGPTQATGSESAEMFVGTDDHDRFPHAFGLHGGHDRGAALA